MHETILQALRSGDAAAAVAAARDAVAANPQDATAQRLLATALRTAGERDAAVAAIERAIELAPDDAELHLVHAGLLLDERQIDEAQAALARTIGLDPNQFPAYIVQGQLAIARGDFDEAERLGRLASRIDPEHPHVAAVLGMADLRRGKLDAALAVLARAAERAPNDEQVRHALGFVYMAKGHFAFAEQAFRTLLEQRPGSRATRLLLVDLIRRQGRVGEAADMLDPLLVDGGTPALKRKAGMLHYDAGRKDRARALLREAFEEDPTDRHNVAALVELWRHEGATDEARAVIDAALARHPAETALWHARLAFEPFASDQARAVVARWLEAAPDTVQPLMAQCAIEDACGETDAADAIALRITELAPGHSGAEMRVVESLLRKDPEAAIARIDGLIVRAPDPNVKRALRQWLGLAFDAAAQPEAAAATWAELRSEQAQERAPYPPVSGVRSDWPELAPRNAGNVPTWLLWGLPGSMVERLVATVEASGVPLRRGRVSSTPPDDFLQRYKSIEELGSSDIGVDTEAWAEQWRTQLAASGIEGGGGVDWLIWWDNAALAVMRPHMPDAHLVVALRDPRDMLLDWLMAGAPIPYRLASPVDGARWMAQVLAQIAYLHEQDLFPHTLLKLDDVAGTPQALAQTLSAVIGTPLVPAPAATFQAKRFPSGHWRAYSGALAEAFALLTPVAKRLGYAE